MIQGKIVNGSSDCEIDRFYAVQQRREERHIKMEINDIIYGIFTIPRHIVFCIETRVFQRLNKIRQLAFMYMYNKNLNYKRYDHCIGTYYLASKMLTALEKNSNMIMCDDYKNMYRPAVEIAALLHDIGHGPFSHTWERVNRNFKHEQNANCLVEEIFATTNKEELQFLNNRKGIELIKCLINGNPEEYIKSFSDFPSKYLFIFEIVNNTKCKLDVDKWDYLLRDGYYFGVLEDRHQFDDVFLKAKISNDGRHIEYRYQDYAKIYEIFVLRYNYHMKFYRDKLGIISDHVFIDCMQRCTGTITGKKLIEINSVTDLEAFMELHDDNVLEMIKNDNKFKYLQDPKSIQIIDPPVTQQNNYDYFVANIKGPGEEMPPDDCFDFYGNPLDKPNINRNNEAFEVRAYYKFPN